MNYRIGLVALVFSVLMFSACHECETDPSITEVKYGISFGECIGYCGHDITLTDGSSDSHHYYYWGAQDLLCSESYSNWESLTSSINFDNFKDLDAIIGCPDCADGGAEWIEITSDGETHKVTFEYFDEPNTTSGYIQELRDQMDIMKNICL